MLASIFTKKETQVAAGKLSPEPVIIQPTVVEAAKEPPSVNREIVQDLVEFWVPKVYLACYDDKYREKLATIEGHRA